MCANSFARAEAEQFDDELSQMAGRSYVTTPAGANIPVAIRVVGAHGRLIISYPLRARWADQRRYS